ncbi:MAG: hypothetical protein JRE19_07600 [Deltaproteobacteria bacterium]|nr:hypothetical protein [Deltaproteobacteria bacterium]
MPRGTGSWSAWGSALAFFLAGLFPLFNADAYGHLAQGRQIVVLGRVPQVDLFSFWQPVPQPWKNYEWAYDWVTWLVYDHFGANALILLKCLALGALGYLLVKLAGRLAHRGDLAAPLTLTALLLALPVARFRFTTRPQIVGLLLPAVLLVGIGALYEDRLSSRRKAWILGALGLAHVVWVNSHGSHLFGVAITLIFATLSFRTAAFRWMIGLLLIQGAATGCTPFGFSIAMDAVSHVLRPEYRELVVEWAAWAPKDPLRLLVAPMVCAVFVLAAMRPVTRESRFGVAYGVLCVLLSIMAFRSMRFVAHQLLFCAPFIAAGLSQLPGLAKMRRSVVGLIGVAAASSALWMMQMVPALGFGFGEPKREYPWASAEVVEQAVDHPRIVASIQDSWFLMFAAPGGKLLIDGRVPYYGPEMIRRVSQSFTDPGLFSQQLAEYDVNTVVIDHTRSDHIVATEYLSSRNDWALAFVEDGHSLFVRRDASPGLQPFEIAGPGYRTGRLLDAGLDDIAVSVEVARLGSQLNTASIHAWHEGLELLRPLARDGARAGIRKSRNDDEQARARAAYEQLSVAASSFPGFTSIELYRAMAALSACDISEAREALGRAVYGGQTRGTSLAALELSLRAGAPSERSAAAAHVARLSARPDSRDDPWVAAIVDDIDVHCPAP